jgi:DUF1680 family protein
MRQFTQVRFPDVTMDAGFWRERLETVLTRTIPSQYRALESHGILESLRVPSPPPPFRIPPNAHGFTTQIFWDSDVGKWIESASYALSHRRDAEIERQIDEITGWLAKAQLPDGYLDCWYIGRAVDKRWSNLRDNHELYCAGHMIEGAVAYFQATGRRQLLDIFCRYVDHIASVFGPGPGLKRGYCGHQEIELALIKLYHATGTRKYLDLAAYFINERGNQNPHYFDVEAVARGENPKDYRQGSYEYSQSHKPVREQDKVVGHAVRAMYMYSAMADLASDLGDSALKAACEALWRDVTSKRMYVTAGLGPSASNEGFTVDYDLPNDTAYAETCASVALIFWAQRMLNLDCEGAYGDILELALYNGALSGLSRDGVQYFYQNPLESDGTHKRWDWHPCPCCTMNVSRLVASIGGYFYSTGAGVVAVHLYGSSTARLTIDGQQAVLVQQADYPWSGKIRFALTLAKPAKFTLQFRIPGWARSHTIAVNGASMAAVPVARGYAQLNRQWRDGDVVDLELPMPVERIYANPNVKNDVGRVALKRGPLVYCCEQADNPSFQIPMLRLPRPAPVEPDTRPDLLGGIVTLVAGGQGVQTSADADLLYHAGPYPRSNAEVTLVPYYAWCNRGANRMAVWLAED